VKGEGARQNLLRSKALEKFEGADYLRKKFTYCAVLLSLMVTLKSQFAN
jgi:hypothetical protein